MFESILYTFTLFLYQTISWYDMICTMPLSVLHIRKTIGFDQSRINFYSSKIEESHTSDWWQVPSNRRIILILLVDLGDHLNVPMVVTQYPLVLLSNSQVGEVQLFKSAQQRDGPSCTRYPLKLLVHEVTYLFL